MKSYSIASNPSQAVKTGQAFIKIGSGYYRLKHFKPEEVEDKTIYIQSEQRNIFGDEPEQTNLF